MRIFTRFPRAAAAVFALALLVPVVAPKLAAQQAPATLPPIDPQTVLPLDATIRTGTLPNGLKYFIRRNGRPEKRVSLRLAVKTGSLEEADDQQGLAHLIEHMAFNGSAHFKPGELVSYFERLGARLGPHVNAYTSFDETVYMLDLPTDQGDVVARGLTALSDFAGGLNLDAAEIEKERRRHRGVARRARRRLTGPRQADPGHLLQLALRRPAAHRQARDPANRSAGQAARLLRHVVSPGAAGRDRGR